MREFALASSMPRRVSFVNGVCAGGGYELALACDEIWLVDDGAAAVSLPEAPLLGVLPGTGGLTRVVDKRKVRRDLADVFGTLVEGVKGRRAVEWRLVDAVHPTSRFKEAVATRVAQLATGSDRPHSGPGITLHALDPEVSDASVTYRHVSWRLDREHRVGHLTVRAPTGEQPSTTEQIHAVGDDWWPLRAFRELDDALLRLRLNEPEIGTIVVRTEGQIEDVLAMDRVLAEHAGDWLVREVILQIKRTLKRMALTARSFFALSEPGSAFAGSLFELALAADRSYMLDDPDEPNAIALSKVNGGAFPMSNGLTRLETRFLGEPRLVTDALAHDGPFDAGEAMEAGLVSCAPGELDWDDEVRLAVESRAALSPDALTGMEANLRFAGPETMETKIFGRLTAWQNWIFIRPNAVGEKGALTAYGSQSRPEFDYNRT